MKEILKEELEIPIQKLPLLPAISVDEDASLKDVYLLMQEKKIGCILVTKFDVLVGIITEKDFLFHILGKIESFEDLKVKEVMTKRPIALKKDAKLHSLMELFSLHDFRHIPVIDEDGCPIHVISIRDLIKLIADFFPDEIKKKGVLKKWNRFHTDLQHETFSLDRSDSSGIKGELFFQPIGKAISNHPLILDESLSLSEVLNKMQTNKKSVAILTEYETKIKGIMTERDFLIKVLGKVDFNLQASSISISNFMTKNPECLLSRHILSYAINNMLEGRYRNVVVVNEDRQPESVLSMLDIFKYLADHMTLDHHEEDIVRVREKKDS
ncbi:MAG: hypothetical protein CME68_09380 [Halobacteriovoraceae bacterium]|nr:hypothetical protein [Halobacteriovoraceae bacterium]